MCRSIFFSFILLQDDDLDSNISHNDKHDNNINVGGSKIGVELVSFFLFHFSQNIYNWYFIFNFENIDLIM